MLTDAAIVYPIATPNKFKYWINPHSMTLFPPETPNGISVTPTIKTT